MTYIVAIACVFGIAAGQLLFKLTAASWRRSGTLFDQHTLWLLASAFLLYGITTIAWIWVLQRIELGRAYPLMALAFVLVPAASYLLFGERFHPQYLVGVALIVIGVSLATGS
jgi:drug/metabolite transporter (DMT)-like permease